MNTCQTGQNNLYSMAYRAVRWLARWLAGWLACLLACRDDFARVYTDDDRVASTVAEVTSVYVMFVFLGGSTQCLRGVLSGCGRQSANARVSLISSYCVGLPISYLFCFQFGW